MVPSNRYMAMISLQQYSPESNHRYCLLEEKRWRYCHNQSLPGLCCAVTDHDSGIKSLFQCYYRSFSEHKLTWGFETVRHLLSISLFITLARGQICLIFSCKNLFISLSICKGAKKCNKSQLYWLYIYRKHGGNSNILRTLQSFCRKLAPASQSHGKTQFGRKSWVILLG